jgi:hypothetical protein
MKVLTALMIISFFLTDLSAQTFPNTRAQLDSVYAQNIKMSKLYGIYIPKDIDDAHDRISQMTPPDAIEKFKNAPDEVEVSRKLHLGIGRWMVVNWNLEEGSRLSHYLKQQGVLHPDDMAQFLLRSYYRKLNYLPDNNAAIIEELAVERKKTVKK